MLTGWLRENPIIGRMAVKLAVVLPLGLAAGVPLSRVCELLGVSQNFAAGGAALAALAAGTGLAGRIAAQLGIPEPEA